MKRTRKINERRRAVLGTRKRQLEDLKEMHWKLIAEAVSAKLEPLIRDEVRKEVERQLFTGTKEAELEAAKAQTGVSRE